MKKGVVVLLSGGQDSATCLAMVKDVGYSPIHTIAFDYGQRHRIELGCSKNLAARAGAIHHEVPINTFKYVSVSNLLNNNTDINEKHAIDSEVPSSFVPGRNLIFLTFAAALAYSLGIEDLYTGVCQTDFSGYADCRDETIKALEVAISLGLGKKIKIHTPLMYATKAEIVEIMLGMGCLSWYEDTHTCYNGKRPPCGTCPACVLRAKGFAMMGIEDPLIKIQREKRDGR